MPADNSGSVSGLLIPVSLLLLLVLYHAKLKKTHGLIWSYMVLISSAIPSFLLLCGMQERGGAGK